VLATGDVVDIWEFLAGVPGKTINNSVLSNGSNDIIFYAQGDTTPNQVLQQGVVIFCANIIGQATLLSVINFVFKSPFS
jgi:hypothetical protein